MCDSQSLPMPRPEYPRPQFVRSDWMNLNGTWEFEIDCGDSGLERGLRNRPLNSQITVPFCPESKLSGIGNTDFLNAVWYRKRVVIPAAWAGQRTLLHFQACDYDTTVWVNGTEVVRHRGGFTPFTCDLSKVATPGESCEIVVRARDDHRRPGPKGKQSSLHENHGCFYTRTTGIWQTVWMEPVPEVSLRRPRITPEVGRHSFRIEQPISDNRPGYSVRAVLRDKHGIAAMSIAEADVDRCPVLDLVIEPERVRLWTIEDPFLYDLEITLVDENNNAIDHVTSYAGLRSVTLDGKVIRINGKAIFQRLVLDQGYYPDGLMTAPSDAELKRDIEISMAAGFNGARLHQKVFEERFLYHADRMGYLCWGEFGDWGCSGAGPLSDHQQPAAEYIAQWCEALERDYSHPSIIGWCPMNETQQELHDRITVLDDVTRGMFLATKLADRTRPVLDASGYCHRVLETEIFDSHNYDQNPEGLAAAYAGLAQGKPYMNKTWTTPGKDINQPYNDQPYFVSEFGGIWWNPEAKPGDPSWGYGDRPKSLEEFFTRFEGLCTVLLQNELMFGYCYTQLTDVFQEQNGIYHFDRRSKFSLERIRKAQTQVAAIEKLDVVRSRKRSKN